MPGKDLPLNVDFVQGLGYYDPPTLTDDACSLAGVEAVVPGTLNPGTMTPVPVSLATQTMDAPPLGAFLLTNLHDDNYLDPTTPHISPESQKG